MLNPTVARYAAVGLLTLAVYLAAGHAARALGLPFAAEATLPFALAVAANYLLQRGWVFRDPRPTSASLPRYAVMVGLGCLINAMVLAWSPPQLPLWATQLAAAVLVVASNALLAFTWVFLRPDAPEARGSRQGSPRCGGRTPERMRS